jgi:hypothetical protein
MKLNAKLLAIIGKLNPEAFDAIFPHGPVIRGGAARLAGVAGSGARQIAPTDAGAIAAQHFVATQWTAQRLNIAFDADPDWWCPTGIPRKLPPIIFPPPPPEPGPDWMAGFYLGFASHLAVTAESIGGRDIEGLTKAMDHALGGMEQALG